MNFARAVFGTGGAAAAAVAFGSFGDDVAGAAAAAADNFQASSAAAIAFLPAGLAQITDAADAVNGVAVPAIGLPVLACLNLASTTIQPKAHAAVPPAVSQIFYAQTPILSATALIAPRAATPALTRVRVETLNFGEMLQNVARQVGGARASAAASQTAGEKLKALLGKAEGVDPAEIAAACADDGCRIAVEKTAGNATTGGMTWRREKVGDSSVYGLRGTTYCRFDEGGKLLYVREGSEPLLKPGEATEALLKAVTANAYPKGATPAVALELFAEDIRYEDFNYPAPFLGKPAVKEFAEALDIPASTSCPWHSGGDVDGGACCFTWIVKVNGQDGPKGILFYESDGAGKISYIRDIPATTPAPLQAIAALVNPELRVFSPRAD
ncbi:hypothetical protein JL722_6217 [Aureococcus anophagefferens]|nr:hypothetical protein JL722_6217 [Aureococcus anophagefferens]